MGVDFDRLRREVDLPAIVMNDTPLICRRGDHWRGRCPFHGGRNFNFAVYRSSRDGGWRFFCHSKCMAGGDVIDYLRQRYGYTLPEALRHLGRAPRRTYTWDETKPQMPQPDPLHWRTVGPYERALDLPIDWTGKDPTTGADLWHDAGMDDDTIAHFHLGYCPKCPMAFDPTQPERKWPSLTIPIFSTNGAGPELHNIRHRLIQLPAPGDKYRPHAMNLGVHLFNSDSLKVKPTGEARELGPNSTVLIIEGEKKVMAAHRFDLWEDFALISDTGGAGAWIGPYGDVWEPLLYGFDRVVVIRDPGMESVAEQTARRWGRHGFWLPLAVKLDDWLLDDPAKNVPTFIEMVWAARPAF